MNKMNYLSVILCPFGNSISYPWGFYFIWFWGMLGIFQPFVICISLSVFSCFLCCRLFALYIFLSFPFPDSGYNNIITGTDKLMSPSGSSDSLVRWYMGYCNRDEHVKVNGVFQIETTYNMYFVLLWVVKVWEFWNILRLYCPRRAVRLVQKGDRMPKNGSGEGDFSFLRYVL